MKKITVRLLPALFFSLTAVFFSSLEVYLGNIAEFTFPAVHVWRVMALLSIGIAAGITLVSCLLPERLADTVGYLLTGGGICFYIQSMFLNGSLQELNGENTVFGKDLLITNGLLWLILLFGFFFLMLVIRKKAGRAKALEAILLCSAGLTLIQGAGLASTAAGVDPQDAEKNCYLSNEKEFELSSGKNVLIFILDNCDRTIVEDALAEDPSLFDGLDGFVSYPDTTSRYSRTYPAVPYLLTGRDCSFDVPHTEYISDAYADSGYLRQLHETGTDIRLYTALSYVSPDAYELVDNVSYFDSRRSSAVSVPSLIRSMLRLGGYREMPYLLKPFFSYTIDPINRNVLTGSPVDYFTLTNNDFEFNSRISDKSITVTDSYPSAFRFYHLFGPHPGCYMNEEALFDYSASQAQALRGDFKILKRFFERMKANGVYDNSTIIITADHGNQNEGKELQLLQPACCIMLVKPAGESGTPVRISTAQISHSDLFATVYDGLGLDSAVYGQAIYDIPEDTERERLYYYTAQISATDGEVALREYRITGNALDFSNWTLTGNDRDILYSANSVSKAHLNG